MNPQRAGALVTGGASGLGLGVARALVKRGARVVVLDLVTSAGPAAVGELGEQASFVACDVTDTDQVARRDRAVRRAHGAGRLPGQLRRDDAERAAGAEGRCAALARHVHPPPRRERDRHVRRHPPRGAGDERAGAEPGGGARPGRQRRVDRGVRGSGGPGRLRSLQGRDHRHDASPRTRAGAARDPRRHDRAGRDGHAHARRARRRRTRPSGLGQRVPRRLGTPADLGAMVLTAMENVFLNGATVRLDAGLRMPAR